MGEGLTTQTPAQREAIQQALSEAKGHAYVSAATDRGDVWVCDERSEAIPPGTLRIRITPNGDRAQVEFLPSERRG
jgi:hypothetical protein